MENRANLKNITIILHRPHFPENIGAAARAAKNMGIHRLVVVDPLDCDLTPHAQDGHPRRRRRSSPRWRYMTIFARRWHPTSISSAPRPEQDPIAARSWTPDRWRKRWWISVATTRSRFFSALKTAALPTGNSNTATAWSPSHLGRLQLAQPGASGHGDGLRNLSCRRRRARNLHAQAGFQL